VAMYPGPSHQYLGIMYSGGIPRDGSGMKLEPLTLKEPLCADAAIISKEGINTGVVRIGDAIGWYVCDWSMYGRTG
jgi:hypothetical protein